MKIVDCKKCGKEYNVPSTAGPFDKDGVLKTKIPVILSPCSVLFTCPNCQASITFKSDLAVQMILKEKRNEI